MRRAGKNQNDGATRPIKMFDDIMFSPLDTIHEHMTWQMDGHRMTERKIGRSRTAHMHCVPYCNIASS